MTDATDRARFEGDELDDEFDDEDEELLDDDESELSPIEGMVHDGMNAVAVVPEPEDG
jgi:hypothetical protein